MRATRDDAMALDFFLADDTPSLSPVTEASAENENSVMSSGSTCVVASNSNRGVDYSASMSDIGHEDLTDEFVGREELTDNVVDSIVPGVTYSNDFSDTDTDR